MAPLVRPWPAGTSAWRWGALELPTHVRTAVAPVAVLMQGGALRVAGTGKTLAAEAVGFETGKPLKVPSAPDAEAVAVFVC